MVNYCACLSDVNRVLIFNSNPLKVIENRTYSIVTLIFRPFRLNLLYSKAGLGIENSLASHSVAF